MYFYCMLNVEEMYVNNKNHTMVSVFEATLTLLVYYRIEKPSSEDL